MEVCIFGVLTVNPVNPWLFFSPILRSFLRYLSALYEDR